MLYIYKYILASFVTEYENTFKIGKPLQIKNNVVLNHISLIAQWQFLEIWTFQ